MFKGVKKYNKIIITKYTLKKHYNVCKGTHPLQCNICKKEFSSRNGKYMHTKYVICEPVQNIQQISTNHNYNTTNNNNNTTNHNITNNNQKTVNIHNHNHIQINAFGSENYDYMIGENNRLRKIIQNKNAFMQKIIEAIHFDEDHPENHNILMTIS